MSKCLFQNWLNSVCIKSFYSTIHLNHRSQTMWLPHIVMVQSYVGQYVPISVEEKKCYLLLPMSMMTILELECWRASSNQVVKWLKVSLLWKRVQISGFSLHALWNWKHHRSTICCHTQTIWCVRFYFLWKSGERCMLLPLALFETV